MHTSWGHGQIKHDLSQMTFPHPASEFVHATTHLSDNFRSKSALKRLPVRSEVLPVRNKVLPLGGKKIALHGGMARKPICPTPPSPSLVAVPGGGFGLAALPAVTGGGGGNPIIHGSK